MREITLISLLQGYTDSPSIFIPLNNEIPFDKQIKLRGFLCNKHPAAALLLLVLTVLDGTASSEPQILNIELYHVAKILILPCGQNINLSCLKYKLLLFLR